jgi:hypothetical protein
MYPSNESLEREILYLLSNQSLSESSDIDPITVVSVDAGKYTPSKSFTLIPLANSSR